MINVLVLCGGRSPEHEISLRSSRNVVSAIDRSKFTVDIIGIDTEGYWHALSAIPDVNSIKSNNPVCLDFAKKVWRSSDKIIQPHVVFPVLHGPNGEDGTIQGLLQSMNLPFVSPDTLGASNAMDKDTTKRLLAHAGIKVANGICLTDLSELDTPTVIEKLGLPVFVKPANMGSSLGVTKVNTEDQLLEAMNLAFEFDSKVLIEEMIHGRELECGILGLQSDLKISSPGEISTEDEYSFKEKYSETSQAKLDIPAKNLDQKISNQLKETAKLACRVLNCEILSRVDMFLTDSGEIYVNEVNTIPGFTSISMYPKLWEYEGIPYIDLITQLLELAIKRQQKINRLKRIRI